MERGDVPGALQSAIEAGYRRVDCAAVYFNEDSIGDALEEILQKQKLVARSELFVVSKLASPFHRNVELGLRKTLNDLKLDYLDLYLVHWPVAFQQVEIDVTKRGWDNEDIDDSNNGKNIDETVSVHDVWKGMEDLLEKGLVKAIGVSNFPVMLLHELLTKAKYPPVVNQVESHPYLQQTNLLKYCQARGIHMQAYSPLGTPGYKEGHEPSVLEDSILQSIAKKHGVSPAQVCLAWAVQRNTSVVVKSVQRQHQIDNLQRLPTLSDSEMLDIAKLDRNYRFFRPEDWWGEKAMAVFD